MTEEKKEYSGNGFTYGLVFGALLGGATVFFLGTEKGKKLLKVITEEGMDSFSNIKEMMEEDYEEELGGPEIVPPISYDGSEDSAEQKSANNGHPHHSHGHHNKKPHPHRFFKKPTKKS